MADVVLVTVRFPTAVLFQPSSNTLYEGPRVTSTSTDRDVMPYGVANGTLAVMPDHAIKILVLSVDDALGVTLGTSMYPESPDPAVPIASQAALRYVTIVPPNILATLEVNV